jgi:hypothetical protein
MIKPRLRKSERAVARSRMALNTIGLMASNTPHHERQLVRQWLRLSKRTSHTLLASAVGDQGSPERGAKRGTIS